MSQRKWTDLSFDPEEYLKDLSPFGYKVMETILTTWYPNGSSPNSHHINEIQVVENPTNLRTTRENSPKLDLLHIPTSFSQYEDINNKENVPLTMFSEQSSSDVEQSFDMCYDRFLSLIASQVSSSPQKQKNTKEINAPKDNIFSVPFAPESDTKQNNSHLINIINKDNNFKAIFDKNNIYNAGRSDKTETLFESKKNNTSLVDLSRFAAPPKRSNKTLAENDKLGTCLYSKETDGLQTHEDILSENNVFKIADYKIEVSQKSQATSSQIFWKLSNIKANQSDIINSSCDIDNNKLKANIIKPSNKDKGSFEIIVDKTVGQTHKRCFKQLKLSDMLPIKKLKKNKDKKCEIPNQKLEIISNIKLKELNRNVNKNVNLWLSKLNDSVDTEMFHGVDLRVQDVPENQSLIDCKELNPQKIDINLSTNEDEPMSSCEIFNVQTIIANDVGRMKYKKTDGVVETLNLNTLHNFKKKTKFIPPISKDVPKKNLNYLIENLDKHTIIALQKVIFEHVPIEFGITILYREGFCQLNKIVGTVDSSCTPKALMFCITWVENVRYFYVNLRENSGLDMQFKKSFISDILNSETRKVCFEAQDVIMLLIDLFKFKREEVCLKWVIIDPKIGCFLLNPDEPPHTFDEVFTQLLLNVEYDITSSCPKEKTAHRLSLLSKCCQEMYVKLKENNIWHVFLSLESNIITILAAMELKGICIDTKIFNEMASILDEQLKQIEREAFIAAGKTFQLNSPSQLRNILFVELKLDTKYNIAIKETSKLGAKSTSEPVLRQLIPLHPLPRLVLNYRHIHKAKATFIDAILQQSKCGVIRTTWEQTSAATGRIVSCNPNLQAIPRHPLILEKFPDTDLKDSPSSSVVLRKAFIPRPSHTFIAADFQHIECRVFAHMTKDKVLMESLSQNKDLFSCLAAKWLRKESVEDILPEERDRTKHLVYALMYGAGTQKLMEILRLGYTQTTDIISQFLASFPSLRTFREGIIKECLAQNGILHSISGRMRKFQNIHSSDSALRTQAERQAINFVIQGSAADLCKTAMVATEHRLANLPLSLNHHLLLQIHDELVWEVPDVNVEQFKCLVQEVMQHSGEFCGGLLVPLPVAIKQGKSWGEMA